MQDPTQATRDRAQFDRRDVQGRRIVERRDGMDQRLEAERRHAAAIKTELDRRDEDVRREVSERRHLDLRTAPRRDTSERRL